jgi:hypothetical protein
VNSDLKVDQLQKCDENDAGHNNAKCTNSSINFLDPIDVFFGDNNNINYDIDTKQINDCDDKRNGDNNSECLNDLKNIITSLTLLGDNGDVGWILVLNKSMIAMIILIADNMLKCNNILPWNKYKDNKYKTGFNYFVHSSCLDGNVQYQGTLSERSLQ